MVSAKVGGTREASNGGRVRARIIHGLNISHKELGGAVLSVLDRSGREDVRLHQPRCANTSVFGLRGYVDILSPLVAMHHHDLACA